MRIWQTGVRVTRVKNLLSYPSIGIFKMKNFGESQLRMKIYKNIYLNLPPYIFEPADREMNLDCFPAFSAFGSGGRASIWLLWQWAIQKQVRTRERARFGSIVVESILRVDLNPLVESRRIQFLADARQIGFLSLNHFCFICYFVLKINTNLFKIYFSRVHLHGSMLSIDLWGLVSHLSSFVKSFWLNCNFFQFMCRKKLQKLCMLLSCCFQ